MLNFHRFKEGSRTAERQALAEAYYTYNYLYRDKKRHPRKYSHNEGKALRNAYRSSKKHANKYGAAGTYLPIMFYDKWQDYNKRCYYCGKPIKIYSQSGNMDYKATIDHFKPLSEGGTNYIENLVPACNDCNTRKGSDMACDFKEGEGDTPIGPIAWKALNPTWTPWVSWQEYQEEIEKWRQRGRES